MAIYELDGQGPDLPADGNYFIADTATIIGKVVRAAPVPISARAATMVTMPSGAIETKTFGSLTTPFGILSAPVG